MKKKTMGQPFAQKKARVYKSLFRAGLLLIPILLASCHARIHEIPYDPGSNLVPVHISVSSIEQIPFDQLQTKASVSQTCTKLTYAVLSDISENAVKEAFEVQNITDSVFGNISLNLSTGKHYLVVVGQNGGDGKPGITVNKATTDYKSTSVRYSSGNKEQPKVLDTFHYCAEINVTRNSNNYQVDLNRSVAMFRLKLTQAIPSQVTKLQFETTNGSATLDVVAGYGCVTTKQDETFVVNPSMDTFDFYTFPQKGKTVLKMHITAWDSYGNAVCEMNWDNIPMTVNKITQYTGDLFQNGCKEFGQASIPITVNNDWNGTDSINF